MNKLQKLAVTAQAKTAYALGRAKAKLQENSGLSTSTEHLLWALGVIVIVGIILAVVIASVKDTILPEWQTKIMEILNLGA